MMIIKQWLYEKEGKRERKREGETERERKKERHTHRWFDNIAKISKLKRYKDSKDREVTLQS